jgi:hypothetical protein
MDQANGHGWFYAAQQIRSCRTRNVRLQPAKLGSAMPGADFRRDTAQRLGTGKTHVLPHMVPR